MTQPHSSPQSGNRSSRCGPPTNADHAYSTSQLTIQHVFGHWMLIGLVLLTLSFSHFDPERRKAMSAGMSVGDNRTPLFASNFVGRIGCAGQRLLLSIWAGDPNRNDSSGQV